MIYSMTGFGRASGRVLDRDVSVEIKSVNNRFRDVIVRAPKTYGMLEDPVKKAVGGRVARGRVEVFIQIDESESRRQRLKLDLDLARTYHDLLMSLKDELGLAGQADIGMVASFRDVITYEDEDLDLESFMSGLSLVLDDALDKLVEMRQTEGQAIVLDFQSRLESMTTWTGEIESRRQVIVDELKEKLETRIKTLTEGVEVDPWRLAQEVAYIIDRGDVTEELVRLASHLAQFGAQLHQTGPAGRRLDFLLQEMNREVNTIGSKSQDRDVTNLVVNLKTEMEKLKEQIQNVE